VVGAIPPALPEFVVPGDALRVRRLRLTVAPGVPNLREAAEKLPVSVTAMMTDIASKRSIYPAFPKIEKFLLDLMGCSSAPQSASLKTIRGSRMTLHARRCGSRSRDAPGRSRQQGSSHDEPDHDKGRHRNLLQGLCTGRPVAFSHGWPRNADARDDPMLFLASRGFLCFAHDRRDHGRSSQTWEGNNLDTYADAPAALIEALDLKGAILIGHSPGGGEVTRYMGRHRTGRVSKAVLIAAIPPLMLKTPANPGGLPIEVFDDIRVKVAGDRSQYYRELSVPFDGANRPGSEVSQGVQEAFWLWSIQAGLKGALDCIKAFSETDLTEDLKRIDVPTLIVQGDDDQIVQIADSALL
jgi:non-heme chloroperoxidase